MILNVANAVVAWANNKFAGLIKRFLRSRGTRSNSTEFIKRLLHARWTKVVALLDIANVGLGNASLAKARQQSRLVALTYQL